MIIVLIILIVIFLCILFKQSNRDGFYSERPYKFKILDQCFDDNDTNVLFTKYNTITMCDIYDNNIACHTPLEYIDELDVMNAKNGLLLHNVCVDPKMRKKGIATKLVYKQLEKAKKMGKEFCMLQVKETNKAAINLYKKIGFNITTTFLSTDGNYHYNMVIQL